MSWRVKHGEREFECPDTATLKRLATEGGIAVHDYVFNPVLNQWLYARDVAEIQGVFGKAVKAEKAKMAKKAGIGFAVVGLLFLIVAPPLGFVCLIAAGVFGVIHHVQAGTVV